MINQLFIKLPLETTILNCLEALGFNGLDDTSIISKDLMINNRSATVIQLLRPELKEYYAPSKYAKYLIGPNATNDNEGELTVKQCITIVKQLLKTINYDLTSKEKMVSGKKILYYNIITLTDKRLNKKRIHKPIQPIIINFD